MVYGLYTVTIAVVVLGGGSPFGSCAPQVQNVMAYANQQMQQAAPRYYHQVPQQAQAYQTATYQPTTYQGGYQVLGAKISGGPQNSHKLFSGFCVSLLP